MLLELIVEAAGRGQRETSLTSFGQLHRHGSGVLSPKSIPHILLLHPCRLWEKINQIFREKEKKEVQ